MIKCDLDRSFIMNYGNWVVKNRWLVIIASVAFIIATSYGMTRLGFENDGRVFFSPENPQLQALDELENTYNREDNVLFVVKAKDDNIFSKEVLTAIEELTERSWQLPFSTRVDSLTNYQHTTAEGDDLIVRDLVANASSLSNEELLRIKNIALTDVSIVKNTINPAGSVTLVNILIIKPDDKDIVREVTIASRDLRDKINEKHPSIEVKLTGGVVFDNAFSDQSEIDFKTLMPMMFIIMIGIIYASFRSITATIATLIVIVSASISALGISAYLGIKVTSPSAMAPVIVLTLAVADSVHFLSTMFHEMTHGAEKRAAIKESLRINLHPIFLTSITTAIGFLSMNSSDAPPFRDLGNIAAIGVMLAFFYSVLLLPSLMCVLPVKARFSLADVLKLDVFGNFVVRNKNKLFVSIFIALVVLVVGISKIELDDNFLEYFEEENKVRVATELAMDSGVTGFDLIEYSIPSGEEGGINEPEYLERVEAFSNWWNEQPEVINTYPITNIYKKLNKTMHGDDPEFYSIPESRELAAQYMLLYEMSLPYGLDLNNRIDVDKSSTRLTVFLTGTAGELRELEEKGNKWLDENSPKGLSSTATGLSLMFAHISERNIHGMLWGTSIALALISIILIIALRSVRIGLISLIPNLLPASMAFGLWGLTYKEVGLAVSVVTAISLGIIVDDTVHFLSKYIRARREHGKNAAEAIVYSFSTVGTAITITSLILICGFVILTFSGFKVNESMGILTAFALGFALITDFLFLPAILIWLDKKKA
ncbi:MAG: MMPL family transporter [Deltaproteobacteria bacterium]|nr:MMPL family transporter [Deltaproteobacteria bacterium]